MPEINTLHERLTWKLLENHPFESARRLEQFPLDDITGVLSAVSPITASQVISAMNRTVAAQVLEHWPESEVEEILVALSPATASNLLRLFGKEDRNSLLAACKNSKIRPIRRLLAFPDDTAGSLMDPNVLMASENISAEEALRAVKRSRSNVIEYIYVVDEKERLTGVVSIRTLLRADEKDTLEQLKRAPVQKVLAQSERHALLRHDAWSTFHALPVVDRNDNLLGVLTHAALREDETGGAGLEEAPLVMAIGEMYWIMLASLGEAILGAAKPENTSQKEVRS